MIERRFINPQLRDLDTVLPDVAVAVDSALDILVFNLADSPNGVSGNFVTVRAIGSQLIDGKTTYNVLPRSGVLFVSDGTSWHSQAGVGTMYPFTAGYTVVLDEGFPIAPRTLLNFLGAGVIAVDNPGNQSTDVTIPGGGSPAFTVVEVSLGSAPNARRSGSFQIADGSTVGGAGGDKPVYIQQVAATYTGKGTRRDESEMDQVDIIATKPFGVAQPIQCYWASQYRVRGNFKFQYLIGG